MYSSERAIARFCLLMKIENDFGVSILALEWPTSNDFMSIFKVNIVLSKFSY